MDMNGILVRPFVFRGTYEQCWRAFAAKVRESEKYRVGTQRARAAHERIAEFCMVPYETARQWATPTVGIPRGIERLRLIAFLEIQGYQVLDLERVRPWARYAGQMIGHGVVSEQEMIKTLELENKEHLLRVINTRRGKELRMSKQEVVKNLWLSRQTALREAKRGALARFDLFPSGDESSEGSPALLPASTPPLEVHDVNPSGTPAATFFVLQALSVLLDKEERCSSRWSEEMKSMATKTVEQILEKLHGKESGPVAQE